MSTSEVVNSHRSSSNRRGLICAVMAILVTYSLPFFLNAFSGGPFLNVAEVDEKIYEVRVLDAYRGGSLGNPYVAEHQDAPHFMPEFCERLLALASHLTGLSPLHTVAVARVCSEL